MEDELKLSTLPGLLNLSLGDKIKLKIGLHKDDLQRKMVSKYKRNHNTVA